MNELFFYRLLEDKNIKIKKEKLNFSKLILEIEKNYHLKTYKKNPVFIDIPEERVVSGNENLLELMIKIIFDIFMKERKLKDEISIKYKYREYKFILNRFSKDENYKPVDLLKVELGKIIGKRHFFNFSIIEDENKIEIKIGIP